MALQSDMQQMQNQVTPDVAHTFAPGQYVRTMLLPADSIIVGKIHRHAHTNIISLGHCLVLTEWGIEEYKAPAIFVSEVGCKRVVLAYEDTVWSTVHSIASTDNIEDQIIAKHYDDIELVGHYKEAA